MIIAHPIHMIILHRQEYHYSLNEFKIIIQMKIYFLCLPNQAYMNIIFWKRANKHLTKVCIFSNKLWISILHHIIWDNELINKDNYHLTYLSDTLFWFDNNWCIVQVKRLLFCTQNNTVLDWKLSDNRASHKSCQIMT